MPLKNNKDPKKKPDKNANKGGQNNAGDKKPKKKERETKNIHVCVCGLSRVVDLYLRQVNNLSCTTEKYIVYIDPTRGSDEDGRINATNGDLLLCVYDVRDPSSVTYLTDRIMPYLRGGNWKMGIAGLGVENRTGGSGETDVFTASRLARQYGAHGTELVCCDGNQMAAGTLALYGQVCPEEFEEEEDEDENDKDKDKNKGKKPKP
ncbi:expressed conserved protein [Echinococcus multilocularis]|uniref:Expressed conserved protein n=1 Tax=Echinococcus multilocularis TaxID=6211 RepID=A0A068YED6_ECHMU|nr:expressed conserved protein [Echinococcus multilocularis]